MATPIQQQIEHKQKEKKLLQFVLGKIRKIKEKKVVKKEEKALGQLEKQLETL